MILFVEQSVTPFGSCPSDEDAMLRRIELCGRVAYKSEDKITPDSAKAFVLMLKKRGHLSVLEHSNIVIKFGGGINMQCLIAKRFRQELYHRGTYHPMHHQDDDLLIAGNVRAWLETLEDAKETWIGMEIQSALQAHYPILFGDEIKESLHGIMNTEEQVNHTCIDLAAHTFKIVTDRGITHELVRHRLFSFTQESTRYINYKNRGLTFIAPEEAIKMQSNIGNRRMRTMSDWYRAEIDGGYPPQIARDWLPHLTKSEIFMTGRRSAWQHFIALRDSPAAHPRIREIAQEIRRYFEVQER
jgi:thymidylate synthase (FAD)